MSAVSAALIEGLAFPVFGVQAGLWDLAGPASPIAVEPFVPLSAVSLLALAGIGALIRPRLGGVLALAGLITFTIGTWGLFGTHQVGSALTIVAPGPGVEWAMAGAVCAFVGQRFQSHAVAGFFRELRNPSVLARVGLFLASVFLAIDVVDHAAGGDWLAALGAGPVEPPLHALLIVAVGALGIAHTVPRLRRVRARWEAGLVGLAVLGLALDASFHAMSGDLEELAGHTFPEMIAHVASYYGIALLAISRFVLRPS